MLIPRYSFRALRSDAELRAYLDEFCAQLARRSGGQFVLDIPVERIRHCTHVVGVFDRRGELVAGYVLNDGPDLLLLSVVPEQQRAAWLRRVALDDMCELNLIWRNDGIGHTAFALLVWPRIIAACVGNGRRFVLGSGYDNPLNRWYRAVGPELIYDGPSLTSGIRVYIYAYTRAKLVATYAASFADNFFARPWRQWRGRR